MRSESIKWFCSYNPAWGRYEVHFKKLSNGVFSFGEITEFVQVEEGDDVKPLIRLDQENAQELMDTLWDAGLRPAGENHLADMRKMVFESFLPTFCDVAKD